MGLISTGFKYLFGLYLLSSYKSLPGAYFVRFYYYAFQILLFPLVTGKNTKNIKLLQTNKLAALGYTELSTYASPFECDLYLHKSNSSYFAELDINRCDLMCKVFQKLFLESKKYPYVPVANVFTNFLKEIKPFEKYTIRSSIFCWDEKWIYVISKFFKKNNTVLCSLSLTKYVLKEGRKTIKPQDALEFCGCYNEEIASISAKNLQTLTEKSGFHDTILLEEAKTDYFKL